ncbi:protein PIGBOS1 [Alosa alosa]|uniref:protein PIGBOS1 n=1 Tax=Alosa sapidissima TaxID=34773 RepID=UPI001C08A3B8|nr:protein PIGBOS1 [Alosa sapidissima]XP_048118411.1 protein PIGBOS1 [Alosa alosa]
MFRRRIPLNEIALATLLGVAGGIYVYKPMFGLPKKPQTAELQEVTKQENGIPDKPSGHSIDTS